MHILRVLFPSTYPYFPFQVFAPSLSLKRHQDPYSKALCFVARIETEWSTQDTAAKYLNERLPELLKANESDGEFEGEAREGAPVTPYLQFEPNSVVLTGDWALPADVVRGTLILGTAKTREIGPLRAALCQVKTEHGGILAELDTNVSAAFEKKLSARWVRLSNSPKSPDPRDILAQINEVWPSTRTPNFQGGDVDVIGFVYPDEVRYHELRDVWVFLVRRKAGRSPSMNRNKRGLPTVKLSLVREDRVARSDLLARVPSLSPLITKKASVFGLGALGSIVTWQLARSGVAKLAITDFDIVNAATTPRWLLGVPAAGRAKPNILAEHLKQQHPYLEIDPIVWRVGHAAFDYVADDFLNRSFEGSDIIIDCTVEKTSQHYLSSIAWERGIPYVWASATPGAWGGIVGRIHPDRSRGCWNCFRSHLFDNKIKEPPAEPGPDIQPDGCDTPTFRGTGFDLDEISTMCARLAVSTLCRGHADGYGAFPWDVATVELRQDDKPIPPRWTTYELQPHRDCDAHG